MNGYAMFNRDFEALAIPQSALMRYSGGEGVVGVVTPEDRVHFASVTYSVSGDGWVAIDSGISADAKLVVAGQTGLHEGDKITIQSTAEPQK